MMHQASIEADAPQAEHIVRALEEAIEPEAVAVGLFDRGHGRFEIFAHYAESPPRDALLLLIARGQPATERSARSTSRRCRKPIG